MKILAQAWKLLKIRGFFKCLARHRPYMSFMLLIQEADPYSRPVVLTISAVLSVRTYTFQNLAKTKQKFKRE